MAAKHLSVGGANDDTDHDTLAQRSTGIKRRTITFDEIKHTALTTTPEPFTSPLSCAWLAMVLIGLFIIVSVILTLCYLFKKGHPPLPTSPSVLHVTTSSQKNSNHYTIVANITLTTHDKNDGTMTSRKT
ncbi:uncharacterized protein LOC144135437 isoform X2 [Amblyomma americanum]|uniref:Uncharacterized protein n=1 Tax=Amblyomma americanum TaxID=6943 RepID=A0AAQ4EI37_AMBAM